jgi:predicted component of type VI protein secretion system
LFNNVTAHLQSHGCEWAVKLKVDVMEVKNPKQVYKQVPTMFLFLTLREFKKGMTKLE